MVSRAGGSLIPGWMITIQTMVKKRGFHRWAWLVVLLLGGLLMIYGGVQDVMLFVAPSLAPVPTWHSISPVVGLVSGLIVLASAGLNIVWGWRLRCADGPMEHKLAVRVAVVSGIAMIADWICGYYGFGSLMALLTGIWLMAKRVRKDT